VRIYLRVEINGMIFRFGQEIIVVIALHEWALFMAGKESGVNWSVISHEIETSLANLSLKPATLLCPTVETNKESLGGFHEMDFMNEFLS
jgi:hypothetical protein